jgi:hypothetical protein
MFTNVGVANSAGIVAALIVGVSILPTMFLQWRGKTSRGERERDTGSDQEQSVGSKKL